MPSNTYLKHIFICPGIPKIKSLGKSKLSREDYATIGFFLTPQDPFERKKKRIKWRKTSRLDVLLSEQIKSQKRTIRVEAPRKGRLAGGDLGSNFTFQLSALKLTAGTLWASMYSSEETGVTAATYRTPVKIKWKYMDKQSLASLAWGYVSSSLQLLPPT